MDSLGVPNGEGTANGALFVQASIVMGDARFHNKETESVLKIAGKDSESGYNTGSKKPKPPFDASKTRDILVSELTARLMDGNWYYEFIIKINETGSTEDKHLSVNAIELYSSTTPSQTTTVISELGTLRWSLDADGVDNRIYLNYGLSGSNGLSMVYYVPIENFLGSLATDYLYVYYEMGEDVNDPYAYGSNAGAEEMALFTTPYYGEWVEKGLVPVEGEGDIGGTPGDVPEPATMTLLALGGIAMLRGRKR